MKPDSLHEAKTFADLDLRAGLDRVELVDCTLRSCQLGEARLERCRFEGVRFEGCDLSSVKLGGSSFQEVVFVDCKLSGVHFSGANDLSFDVEFRGCVLDYASFVGLSLQRLSIDEGRAHDAVFADCDLRQASFTHVDLAGASLTGNDLRGADLSSCANLQIAPGANRFKRTKLPAETAVDHLRDLGILVPGL